MSANTPYIEPHPSPAHTCINANCGCDDLISAGPCAEWCGAHSTEKMDVLAGKAADTGCECGHELCSERRSQTSAQEPATDTIR